MKRSHLTRTPASRSSRRGYALVLYVMLFVVILGLAALVIDVGFARLAQRQMLTATDTAALEGLRWRDEIPVEMQMDADLIAACGPPPETPQTQDDPQWQAWRDCARRQLAKRIAQQVFDDNLDPADGDPRFFGAGPVLGFAGGFDIGGGFRASQQLSIPDTPVYKPDLQTNPDNEPAGDMVAGNHTLNPDYPSDEPRNENRAYQRRDFLPNSAADAQAFLVRMRRTAGDVTTDSIPGVSSRGPAVPYLFARGSLLALETRGRGIIVRSTSIASAETGTVKTVGAPQLDERVAGIAPFGLRVDYWNERTEHEWIDDGQDVVWVHADGTLRETVEPNSTVRGIVTASSSRGAAIGQLYEGVAGSGAMVALTAADSELGVYVPLVTTIDSVGDVVAGFGFVEWSHQTASGSATALTLRRPWNATEQRLIDRVAAENVSTTINSALPNSFAARPDSFRELMLAHLNIENALLAPALVNRHLGRTQ